MASTYEHMIVEANEVPLQCRLLASALSWIVLAGFFMLPGTFTSLKKSEFLQNAEGGQAVGNVVQNLPLLPLAIICYLFGVGGLGFLWSKYRSNYIWLLANIFM